MNQGEKRYTPYILAGLVLLGVLALVILLSRGCQRSESLGDMTESVSLDDLELCERKMNVSLPATATPLGIWKQAEPNESIKLKLTMTRRDLRNFLLNSPFQTTTLSPQGEAIFGPKRGWWDPVPPKILQVAMVTLDDGSQLSIGIDEPPRGAATVYLAWFSEKPAES